MEGKKTEWVNLCTMQPTKTLKGWYSRDWPQQGMVFHAKVLESGELAISMAIDTSPRQPQAQIQQQPAQPQIQSQQPQLDPNYVYPPFQPQPQQQQQPAQPQRGSGTGNCRGCGKQIYWGKTANGKPHPYDDQALTMSHFDTCPNASNFRAKK